MAMSKEELLKRIEKKKNDIEKINKRIAKWSKGLRQQDIDIVKPFGEPDYVYGTSNYKQQYAIYDDYKAVEKDNIPESDDWNKGPNFYELYSAYRDLGDNKLTLNKYKNALALVDDKNSKPVIKIFKEFFDNQKEDLIEWVKPLVDKYFELESKSCDLHNSAGNREKYPNMTREECYQESNKLWEKARAIRSIYWVDKAIDLGVRRDKAQFRKFLDKYYEDRYWELINKVTKVTGEITDVTRLKMGYDGSINGTIIGDNGKAKIETIVTSGDNENIIVNVKHGQRAHYRVLVHKIK